MTTGAPRSFADALRRHAPEYAMEAAGLGLFMVSACAFGTLLEHPGSPVRQLLPDATLRRFFMGSAMGLTAIAIIYSPWGKRSGAHLNPAVTLAFYRLGRVPAWDACLYSLSQILGATAGVLLMAVSLGSRLAVPQVRYVITAPGPYGPWIAFAAELAITFLLMAVVLLVSNSRWARWTGVCAGILVAVYITFEAPLSGMSLNPARSFGSSAVANLWLSPWIYWIAPPLGMLLAGEAYVRSRGAQRLFCAKLHHQNRERCIFCDARAVPNV